MSNPITPTILETALLTDTSATALVVGGAIGATTGTGGVKAGPIVSSSSVSDSVGTMATLRAGGIGIASQAALDFVYASSATQLARIVKGTSLQYLRMNSGATGYEFGSVAPTLVKEGTGTTTSVAAENVDTYALASTLTIKDALLVFVRHRNTGAAANIVPVLYDSTDSVNVATLSTANNNYYTDVAFISAQSTSLVGGTLISFGGSAVVPTRSTFTTLYTGAWTLALRHGGVTAGDSWVWEWAVYRISGQ